MILCGLKDGRTVSILSPPGVVLTRGVFSAGRVGGGGGETNALRAPSSEAHSARDAAQTHSDARRLAQPETTRRQESQDIQRFVKSRILFARGYGGEVRRAIQGKGYVMLGEEL